MSTGDLEGDGLATVGTGSRDLDRARGRVDAVDERWMRATSELHGVGAVAAADIDHPLPPERSRGEHRRGDACVGKP